MAARIGWQLFKAQVPLETIQARLSACPMAAVKEAMQIIPDGFDRDDHGPYIRYKRGLSGEDEIACGRWILLSFMPDEHKLSPMLAEEIFDWVRETV